MNLAAKPGHGVRAVHDCAGCARATPGVRQYAREYARRRLPDFARLAQFMRGYPETSYAHPRCSYASPTTPGRTVDPEQAAQSLGRIDCVKTSRVLGITVSLYR